MTDALAELYSAIQDDDAEAIARAIQSAPPDQLGGPLVLAVNLGRSETVGRLLEAGADVHWVSSLGTTPLHQAALAFLGKPEHAATLTIVPQLLAAGADPTMSAAKTARVKGTPLTYAASSGSPDVLALLLADARTHDAKLLRTTLEHAATGLDASTKVELLLERGAKPTLKALLGACGSAARSEMATLLLEHGAPAIEADKRGCTALHLAVMTDSVSLVEALLSRGAKTDIATTKAVGGTEIRKGDTPRDLAMRRARWHQQTAVEVILRAADVRPGEVAAACAKHAPNADGVWSAAIDYCASAGKEAAAVQLADPSFRSALPENARQRLAALADAAPIRTLLGASSESPSEPAVPPGTWRLREVDDSETGPIDNLSKWLGGAALALEISDDGSFSGALRHRVLNGTWALEDGRLVLTDAELGELETELLFDGLAIVEWKNDSELVRYTFAKP